MSKTTKCFLAILVFLISFFAFACKRNENNEEEVKKPVLKIEKRDYELLVGDKETVLYEIENQKADTTVKFESSDDAICKMENDKIAAKKAGNTTIKAYIDGDNENQITLNVLVKPLPVVTITPEEDVTEIYKNATLKLNASISDNSSTSVEWSSSDNTIATVDESGLVTGNNIGTVVISAKIGKYMAEFTLKIVKEPNKFILNFEGGACRELYEKEGSIACINVTSYNGSFWSGTNYASYIFMSTKTSDPGATFSDRIYIGKNSETGFYEVLSVLQSGSSKWPTGAEYVITISNSYGSFAVAHKETEKISVGDVVFFDNPTKASVSKPVPVKFYKSELNNDKIVYGQGEQVKLPIPSKLGNTFKGWVDKDGNSVTKGPDSIVGLTNVYASWYEKDPVTALNISEFETSIRTGDKINITASVSPSNAYFKKVLFSTSNKDIVSISENGQMVGVNAGNATITIRDYVGKFIRTFDITVNMIESIDLAFAPGTDGVLSVNETLQLQPVLVGGLSGNITYSSSDQTVLTVDATGLVKALKEGTAEITITAGSASLTVGFTVNNLNEATKVDEVIKLIAENNFAVVDTGNFCLYNDGRERYYAATYGSVNRYLATPLDIDTKYTATAEGNGSGHKSRRAVDTIEFVCVHDTATLTGTSESIASYMASGSVSIHYTVGNDLIWAVVPEKYIAYHAGDGTGSTFTWFDTGVSATQGVKPKFTIVSVKNDDETKYYYACNGITTTIEVPSCGSKVPSNELLTYLGPTWKVQNGKYYMGLTWWSSDYGKISSHGGNNNSIGIEMNVNTSNDIYDTWQRTAKLVADICIRNNLDTTRVQMHNTFSGKNCAQVILAGDAWHRFMEMVELEYALQTKYTDATITFTSNNTDILGDDGRIIKAPAVTTTVSYDVTVTIGTTSKTIRLYSVVPGTTTWEQWNGTYAASVIWRNGKYFDE